MRPLPPRQGVVDGGEQAQQGHEQHGPEHDDAEVIAEAARQAAWALHAPDPVQRFFNLLHGTCDGPDQQGEPEAPEHATLRPFDEAHHLRGQTGGLLAEWTEEFIEQGFEVAMETQPLQDGEAEGDQRNDGQQCGEHQPGCAQVEITAEEVAHECVRVAQQTTQPVQGASRIPREVEQEGIESEAAHAARVPARSGDRKAVAHWAHDNWLP